MQILDYIIIENYDSNKISQNFQEKLIHWIKRGHNIFLGSDKYKYKTLTGIFETIDKNEITHLGYGNIIPIKYDLENTSKTYISSIIQKYSTYLNLINLVQSSDIINNINESKKIFSIGDLTLKPTYSLIYALLGLLGIYMIFLFLSLKKKSNKMFSISIITFSAIFLVVSLSVNIIENNIGKVKIKEYGEEIFSCGITNICNNENNTIIDIEENYVDNFGQNGCKINFLDSKVLCGKKGDYNLYTQSFKEQKCNMELFVDKNQILNGEIQNPLSSKLENCFLIIGDTVINIGTLKGKEKVNIKYKLDYILENNSDFSYLDKIYDMNELNNNQRQLFEYYYYSFNNTPYNCKLVGYIMKKDSVKINNKNKKVNEYAMNVF